MYHKEPKTQQLARTPGTITRAMTGAKGMQMLRENGIMRSASFPLFLSVHLAGMGYVRR